MRLFRLIIPALFGGTVLGSASAQIPTRKPNQQTVQANLPRLLLANPHTYSSQDSSASVQVGAALRLRMEKVASNTFFVIPRLQMNEALTQFGYPNDAVLPLPVQRNFASSMQARTLLSSQIVKTVDGRYSVMARLAGLNDDAGNTVLLVQSSGQTLDAFGAGLADGFQPAVKTSADAKACIDQRTAARDKAIASAKKALAVMPTNGLAHYCLAEIAFDKKTKADSEEAIKHLQEATVGDQLSLKAWTELAQQYEVRGDTNKTVDALVQMLLIAPTNQPLREQAFKLFLKYERPKAAKQAAEEGLKLDPTNADLWDLLGNACVYLGDYKCALDALDNVVANDSTKADSNFILKATVFAAQQPDTVRLLSWAQRGVKKYPTNLDLIKALLQAYNLTGPCDSIAVVTSRVMALDTGAVAPALAAGQCLSDAKRAKEALAFLQFAIHHGDQQAKEAAASILLKGALPLLQEPQDLDGAADLLRQGQAIANPTGKIAAYLNYYLGLTMFLQVTKYDPDTEKQKSCELAQKERDALADAEKFMTAGSSAAKPEEATKYLDYIKKYQVRAASLVKVFCK